MTEPIVLNITLDLDKHLIGRHSGIDDDGNLIGEQPTSLEELVLDIAARKVVATLDREVRSGLRQRVATIRDEVIREAIEPTIIEALSGPIQRTNAYGEPVGSETTLREIIVETAKKSLQIQQPGNRRAYELNAATKVLVDEVERSVKSEVKKVVDQVKAETYDTIKAAAAEAIAKAAAS